MISPRVTTRGRSAAVGFIIASKVRSLRRPRPSLSPTRASGILGVGRRCPTRWRPVARRAREPPAALTAGVPGDSLTAHGPSERGGRQADRAAPRGRRRRRRSRHPCRHLPVRWPRHGLHHDRDPLRAQGRAASDRAGRAGAQVRRRSSATPSRAIAPGDHVHVPQPGLSAAWTPITSSRSRDRRPSARVADAHVPGHPAPQRQGRDPQHDRPPDHGELLGQRVALHRRRGREARPPARLPDDRRHRGAHPHHRLRHAHRGRGLRAAATDAGGLRQPPELRGRAPAVAWAARSTSSRA